MDKSKLEMIEKAYGVLIDFTLQSNMGVHHKLGAVVEVAKYIPALLEYIDALKAENREIDANAAANDKEYKRELAEVLAKQEEIKAHIKALEHFKDFWDSFYGQGLEVANWHLNGELEPFDNFYDNASQEVAKIE